MKIYVKNEAGMTKELKIGWSWTTFFFGVFVPLIRGDLKWFAIMFLTNILVGTVTAGFGLLGTPFLFAFFYNKVYAKDLYEKGYRAADSIHSTLLLNYVNS